MRWFALARFWNLERALLTLFLFVAAGMWILSQRYAQEARQFPQLISVLVFILGAYVLLVQVITWRRRNRTAHAAPQAEAPVMPWLQLLALTLGSILIIQGFGLGTGILVFVAVVGMRLGLRWTVAVPYAVVLSVLIWYAFGRLLRVPLPDVWLIQLF